jgi:beta-lactamase class A
MERLRQSPVGPSGNALLRYGYVPPSLQRMHGRERERKTHQALRLALIGLTLLLTTATAYRGTRLVAPAAFAPPALSAPHVNDRQEAAGAPPAAISAPVALPVAPSAPPVPAAPDGDATRDTLASRAATAEVIAAPADVLPPPRAKATLAEASRLTVPTPVPVPPLDASGLREAILGITAASDGTYGISVIDLASGQKLDLDAAEPMNAASVNKLEILAALYHEVEAGRVRLDTTLTLSATNVQDYGTGVIRYQPLGTRYTLDQLAILLIEQSDNTASYMLAQYLGLSTIDKLVTGWGLTSTIVGQEVSTPQDAARFMQLLYEGKLANAADTQRMLDYLSHTAFNDRIPAGLPAGIFVAHKIGTEVNVENDVALVQMPGRPYVLSIFAKDVTEANAVPVEQAISRAVYQYEQQAKDGS